MAKRGEPRSGIESDAAILKSLSDAGKLTKDIMDAYGKKDVPKFRTLLEDVINTSWDSTGKDSALTPAETGWLLELAVRIDDDERPENNKEKKIMVAAIDFGTTYSGYAYSSKEDYQKDPGKITVDTKWVAGSMSLISLKAPTAVLFDENQKFHSFGFEAENQYSELAQDKKHEKWYFFQRFKMRLHDEKMTRRTEIKDIRGKTMDAITVFSEAIKYLKNHLLDHLETRGTCMENNDIHWILTVPAIWTDSAKQFMREAANKAGIDGSQLSIALEPEVASIFCQISHKDDLTTSRYAKFSLATPGTKYMIIDLGGGTADITVHERQVDGSLREVHKATGGPWGGTQVDEQFYQLLIRIIGAPVFQKFRDDYIGDFIDLQRELETKKRVITTRTTGKVTIKVPSKLATLYRQENGEEIQDAIGQIDRYADQITWEADKIRLEADIFKSLFKPCTDRLISHIKILLAEPDIKGTDIFLMVGGFSESEMMQRAVKDAFTDVRVVIPDDAGLTVVKGAVVFGHHPTVKSRKSKYTYGINISPPFDSAVHPEDHKVTIDKMERCRDVFKCYIREGDQVETNEPRQGKHITLKPHQKEMLLKIFATEKRNPCFVDESGVELLGKLFVDLPDRNDKITVNVMMMFGKTELAVEAVPIVSDPSEHFEQRKFRAYFDFL